MTHKVRVRWGSVSCINAKHMKHIMKMLNINCRNTEHYCGVVLDERNTL